LCKCRRFIAGLMLGIEEYEIEIVPDEEVKTLMKQLNIKLNTKTERISHYDL
jgi:hypothetical protein